MARHGAKMPASFQIDKGRYNSRLVVPNSLFQIAEPPRRQMSQDVCRSQPCESQMISLEQVCHAAGYQVSLVQAPADHMSAHVSPNASACKGHLAGQFVWKML